MAVSETMLSLIKLATTVTQDTSQDEIPAKKDAQGNVIQKAHTVTHRKITKHLDPKILNMLLKKRSGLFESLSKMRAAIKMPPVDQKASFPVNYRSGKRGIESYTYSSLAALINAIDKGIKDSKTDLSFTFNSDQNFINVQKYSFKSHKTYTVPGTRVSVSVRVADGKDGWSEDIGKFTLNIEGQDGQSIGGAYTYARRYSLSLALGVSGLKPPKTNKASNTLAGSVVANSVNYQPSHPSVATAAQIKSVKHYIKEWTSVDHLKAEQPYSWLKKTHKANINLNSNTIKMSYNQASAAIRDMRSFVATKLASAADAKHVVALRNAVSDFAKAGGHDESKIYDWLKKTYNAKINTKNKPVSIVITNANLAKALKAIKGFKAHETKGSASGKSATSKKTAGSQSK